LSMFDDVGAFNEKFGFTTAANGPPIPLSPDLFAYRVKFMLEEMAELAEARGVPAWGTALRELMATLTPEDVLEDGVAGLADQADALVDLAYIALGSAHFMRLPFDACWAEVQRANLEKVPGRTKRGHVLDVTKPAGWRGPDHWPILYAAALSYQGG
jgi:predicted HAD superfamily Cof-like phosphohydrolase